MFIVASIVCVCMCVCVVGGGLGSLFYTVRIVLSSFVIILQRKRELVALSFKIEFLLPWGYQWSVSLPPGAVGSSAICECGFSWSYALGFEENR